MNKDIVRLVTIYSVVVLVLLISILCLQIT